MAPHRAILRAFEAWLLSDVELERPVLDVGCGEGHFASLAFDDRLDVAIDLSIEELAEAARGAVYGSVIRGDARRLPLRERVFGSVVGNSSLEHIEDVDRALREACRVLRPGGLLVATTPTHRFAEELLGSSVARRLGMRRTSAAYGRFFNRISRHFHAESPEVWRARLEDAGFEVERHATYFPPAVLHAFDLCHYLSVPSLVARKTIGTWVVHPVQTSVFFRWLRRYLQEGPEDPNGVYQLVVCHRAPSIRRDRS
jgi:SAM-dependent methyltransferase